MKRTPESPEKLKILKQLGFQHVKGGLYTHKFINDGKELIDLSAVSIPGIIANIYSAGYCKGSTDTREKIKEMLGV